MNFFYHKDAGSKVVSLSESDYHYLLRVRRLRCGQILPVRNLADGLLYDYELVDHKRGTLKLVCKKEDVNTLPPFHTTIALAMVDPKDMYQILPFLNEFSVSELCIFNAEFSQLNRKFNMEKVLKILRLSCMQCGRIKLMDVELLGSLDLVLQRYPLAVYLHPGSQHVIEDCDRDRDSVFIIGPEGGFSDNELSMMCDRKSYSLHTPYIVQAHHVAMYVAAVKSLSLQ